MRAAWKSDRGLMRENNEDCVLADAERGIFLLADGMGGGPAGEFASRLAVITAYAALKMLFRGNGPRPEDVPWVLANVLAGVHSALFKKTLADPALAGMGTTLDMAIVRGGGEVSICHVGDSRVYLLQRHTLKQITNDDNYAGLLAASGVSPDRIPAHFRHILTQAVGLSDELVPEFRTLDTRPGDLVLMCSDGLNAALTDREIEGIMDRNGEDLADMPAAMVAAANERGGPDNVSVIVIEPLQANSGHGAADPPKAVLLLR